MSETENKPNEMLMSIEFGLDRQLVIEKDEGFRLLDTLLKATLLHGFGTKTASPAYQSIKISFMSRQDLKAIELENKITGN